MQKMKMNKSIKTEISF